MVDILTLHVKKEYFEEIVLGTKKEEYRMYGRYWIKRLCGKHYYIVRIACGYPAKCETSKWYQCLYRGYEIKTIWHKEFAEDHPVKVFAIKLDV